MNPKLPSLLCLSPTCFLTPNVQIKGAPETPGTKKKNAHTSKQNFYSGPMFFMALIWIDIQLMKMCKRKKKNQITVKLSREGGCYTNS